MRLDIVFHRDIPGFVNSWRLTKGSTRCMYQATLLRTFYVEACFTGIGAYVDRNIYWAEIPACFTWSVSIFYFAMLNVTVAFRMWGMSWSKFQSLQFKGHCDNAAVVSILSS